MYGSNPMTGGMDLSSLFATPQVRIKRMMIRDTGLYHQQYLRPFQAETNSTVLQFVQNHDPRTPLDANGVASIANQFITPSWQAGAPVEIENGFGEARFRFMMEVETTNGLYTTTELVMGYTNYKGSSNLTGMQQHFDPNMEFYINSVTKIRVQNNQQGNQTMTMLANNHILTGNQISYSAGAYQDRIRNLLPSKVLSNMSLRQFDHGMVLTDTGIDVNTPLLSNRNNGSAAQYLGKIVNGYQQSLTTPDYEGGDGYRNLLNGTINRIGETSVAEMSFMTVLSGMYNCMTNTFTLRDLQSLDPNVQNVIQPLLSVSMIDYRAMSDQTTGADFGTRMALILNSAIPGIMMDYTLTSLEIVASNRTMNGQTFIQLGKPHSFCGVDLSFQLESVKTRIVKEVLDSATFNNQIDYDLRMTCNLTGDTIINLAIGGNNVHTPYVFPTYCDALYSPMLTRNLNDVNTMAENLGNIFGVMTQRYDTQQAMGNMGMQTEVVSQMPVMASTSVPQGFALPQGTFTPSMTENPVYDLSGPSI